MAVLDRKIGRDLWRMRGQVLAVALVIACGVGLLLMSLGTIASLETTMQAYYDRARFADVFATLKRAPRRLAARIAEIDGVQSVETRIVAPAVLDVPGFADPVTGLLSSIPEGLGPELNRLVLRSGRLVAPNRPDEAVVLERFALAHGLAPGDAVGAVINGRRRTLTIVGTAMSPEHAYAIAPGALMPDDRRYGVLWLGQEALAGAFDLRHAFNAVSLTLLPGADETSVIDALDRLIAPYGGAASFGRADQISNWYLQNEIRQMHSLALILPVIFLAVSAFLTSMVVGRIVAMERGVIGLLKAFGYTNVAVAWHYGKLVLAIAAIGIALGGVVGAALGRFTTATYAELFSFPFLLYAPRAADLAIPAALSLAACLAGALKSVAAAAGILPAEAMRPPTPPSFRRGGMLSGRLARGLDQASRIILRNIARRPARAGLTVTGVACALAVLIMALQWLDAIDRIIDLQFFAGQRQTMTVSLNEPRQAAVLQDLAALPGVLAVEPERSIAVRFHAGSRSKRGAISGLPADPVLNLVFDIEGGPVRLPPRGLVLSRKLADVLGVRRGDRIRVEVLEGRRPVVRLPVTGIFETYVGTPAHMRIDAVNRIMDEPAAANMVHLLADRRAEPRLFDELKRTPMVAAVGLHRAAVDMFNRTMAETVLVFVGFFVGFAGVLTAGVTYNAARIALSERGRDLATLRVLGLSRLEISVILLGEIALLTVLALPPGCLLGRLLSHLMVGTMDTELFRVPAVLEPSTYGWAMTAILAAAALSCLTIHRKLAGLDLIAALKLRE